MVFAVFRGQTRAVLARSRGGARRRSPPGGSRCSLHGLLRPLLLFLRLSTAGSTAACASGASPPTVASLSAAGAQALGSGGGSFNYTFTPCSALVGGSSRSRCAAAMLCRDAPLGQPSGTSSSAARGLTPWPPSRTRCDSDGDAGGNESLAAAAARRASAGGRASRVLLLAVRAPLRAAIVVTIAYADMTVVARARRPRSTVRASAGRPAPRQPPRPVRLRLVPWLGAPISQTIRSISARSPLHLHSISARSRLNLGDLRLISPWLATAAEAAEAEAEVTCRRGLYCR